MGSEGSDAGAGADGSITLSALEDDMSAGGFFLSLSALVSARALLRPCVRGRVEWAGRGREREVTAMRQQEEEEEEEERGGRLKISLKFAVFALLQSAASGSDSSVRRALEAQQYSAAQRSGVKEREREGGGRGGLKTERRERERGRHSDERERDERQRHNRREAERRIQRGSRLRSYASMLRPQREREGEST